MELIKDLHHRGISKVYVVEQVRFNGHDTPKYVEVFNELRNEGYIIASTYGDIVWKLPCYTTNLYFHLRFDLEVFRELNQALRMYSVMLIAKGKSVSWIWSTIDCIKKLGMVTNEFSKPEQLEEYLSDPSNSQAYYMARTLLNFIDFYPTDQATRFHDICQKFSESERKRRELPPLMDILIFDDAVNNYFRQARFADEHLRYKPIQLWWAITNIIPMRPNEFLRLRIDCTECAADGTYWITIPRSKKVKQSVRDISPTQTFQISREIYDLIKEFQVILSKHNMESDYLLPQKYYKNFSSFHLGGTSNGVENRWNSAQFRALLKHFNQNVLCKFYHESYTAELLPSHTRHLAIINLFLQGFNMLTIAKMAGHSEINSPSHYYTHAENFVQSYVYNLVRSGMSNNIGRRMSDGFIGWRRAAVDRGKMYSYEQAQAFRPVDYGFCKDDDFPNHCGEDCRPCPYFIFKPSINDHERALKWLEDYSIILQKQANDVIRHMIATSKALSSIVRPDLEESLKLKSRQLQQLMDHCASIELLIMEDLSNE
ncbi:site-specific integrase [Paenibacillus sp. Dod16]|uniref:site-specific integrase n=1 Tax=Paenibacillus sp. Dod16 TaxID=3416392 RepID=UPI003CF6C257